ncbi:programmed cell death protein [Schizosaccharomyces cryophilus OY26]|uniref:Programmed cell death protein n=1 Tax=Schizosaccharomyces cryophilus (strain OY26 / ATCC MYA-4695 / CBS 11777 / NBRC 106824 / NRRL Y48691) TaxID=653667 RepID=S9XG98_SCHCR|nr:programmed cell death protein [Schizosaccharomyces cryophilus OY26]EPY52691.1 programmed cell death protein [Schizosaccharomyces cryophilus OY26]
MEDIDLGFLAEGSLKQSDLLDVECSRVGGPPLLLRSKDVASIKEKCGSNKNFLLQMYAPRNNESSFHRIIYVFVDKDGKAQEEGWTKGIRVFRSQASKTEFKNLDLTLEENFNSKLCSPREIEVDSDPSDEPSEVQQKDLQDVKVETENPTNEPYTKATGDTSFLKFQKCISRAPDQILRYYHSPSSQPLWCNKDGIPTSVPDCSCGAKRILEVQIVSTLLAELEIDHSAEDALDWGVLTIYTCSESCDLANKGIAEEVCWLQKFSDQGIEAPE